MNPSALVATRMLRALGITDRATAQLALIMWCRPSPRLAVADIEQIMTRYPTEPDDLRDAKPPRPRTGNDEPGGYPLGGPPGRRTERGEEGEEKL
jgi:hypothetical protein